MLKVTFLVLASAVPALESFFSIYGYIFVHVQYLYVRRLLVAWKIIN